MVNCMLKQCGGQIANRVRFADLLDQMLRYSAQGMLAWFL